MSSVASASAAAATPANGASSPFLRFEPVGVQAPLCRPFQRQTATRFCPLTAEQCPFLHVREVEDENTYSLVPLADPDEEVAARRGVPFILFRLAPGEEAPFCLLRRTLAQHGGNWIRRCFNPHHALMHWAPSCPAPTVSGLLRPDCRVLHFPHFTELTHKHRWQSGVRRQQAKLETLAASLEASGDVQRAHRLRHLMDFFPTTLLLPSDRLTLLELHESLGGRVADALRAEALAPSGHMLKQRKKNRRSEAVGDVVIRNAAPSTVAPAASVAAATALSPSSPSSPGSSSDVLDSEPSASPPAVAEDTLPLFLKFDLPDFLADFPLHCPARADGGQRASSLDMPAASATEPAVAKLDQQSDPPIWILKPYARGSGHGILITDLHANVDPHWITGQYVATRYVQRPLLLDITQKPKEGSEAQSGAAAATAQPSVPRSPSFAAASPDLRKFDLRLYLFLLSPFFPPSPSSSVSSGGSPSFPFQVFLHRGGLVRFASEPYDDACLAPERLGTRMEAYVHLTNNAMNVSNEKKGEQQRGCWENWSVDTLKRHFDEQRAAAAVAASSHPTASAASSCSSSSSSSPTSSARGSSAYAWCFEYVWAQVRHLMVQSLCTSDAFLRSGLDRRHAYAFELFGIDALVDENFRVHLCEINSMPDLLEAAPMAQYHQTFPVDHAVKSRLLADVFNLLRFPADPAAEGAAREEMPRASAFERLL